MERKRHPLVSCCLLILVWAMLAGCGKGPKPPLAEPGTIAPADTATRLDTRRPQPPKPVEEMNRAERLAFVRVLADSGYYRCCIDPSCTMCLYEADSQCECGDHVRMKDPVCGECYRGWNRGKGSIQGVNPANIRRQ